MDQVLEALYDAERKGGLGSSSPNVARWLGDIRDVLPSSVVRVMQSDALSRLNLTQMLLEPEMLEAVDADVHLVATLLSLSRVIPAKTKDTARRVVRKVVEDLQRKLRDPMVQAVRGSLQKATRSRRPRTAEIDWDRTIRANLRTYMPERRTIVPERLIGYGRKRSSLRDIVLCVDQSGSMATSVVYSSIFGAVLASLRAVTTRMVVFDTAIADLTDELDDPVDLLFGTQLGGGTDINLALVLLPADHHPASPDDPRAHHRPLRGRQRPGDGEARGVARAERRQRRVPSGSQRSGRALLRPEPRGAVRDARGSRPSRVRQTSSPT